MTYPNLYYLKYFSDAVDLGSMSGAAQKNLVTHPAISKAISTLENHLGVQLFIHKKKVFKVTEAGLQFAEQARLLLSAAEDFNSKGLKSTDGNAGTISIGISATGPCATPGTPAAYPAAPRAAAPPPSPPAWCR